MKALGDFPIRLHKRPKFQNIIHSHNSAWKTSALVGEKPPVCLWETVLDFTSFPLLRLRVWFKCWVFTDRFSSWVGSACPEQSFRTGSSLYAATEHAWAPLASHSWSALRGQPCWPSYGTGTRACVWCLYPLLLHTSLSNESLEMGHGLWKMKAVLIFSQSYPSRSPCIGDRLVFLVTVLPLGGRDHQSRVTCWC